jgi:hypothetical protein
LTTKTISNPIPSSSHLRSNFIREEAYKTNRG